MARIADPLRKYADSIPGGLGGDALHHIADQIDEEHKCRMQQCERGWISVSNDNMLDMLNTTQVEAVINASRVIATRPNVTVDELRDLMSVIGEIALCLVDRKQVAVQPMEFKKSGSD